MTWPRKEREPAAAGTADGFDSKALLRACGILNRLCRHAKRHRAHRAARIRSLVEAVIRDQRGEGRL